MTNFETFKVEDSSRLLATLKGVEEFGDGRAKRQAGQSGQLIRQSARLFLIAALEMK